MSAVSTAQAKKTQEELLELYREAAATGVPLDEVRRKIEELEFAYEFALDSQRNMSQASRWRRIASIVSVTLGSILMANAIWPILSYQFFTAPQLQRVELVSPISQDKIAQVEESSELSRVEQAEAKVEEVEMKPIVLSQQLDYTNLANWFVDSGFVEMTEEQQDEVYVLEIPALNIKEAKIQVGGTDLNSTLIQYPGTADPGDFGSPVIFGHSVLRQFYHPDVSNPNRYKSIFSKIMTLEPGDEIFVTHESVRYTYIVKELHDVQPTDQFILEQRHRSKQLKLVTCVPEGTYLRRGVVVAELQGVE